jgi:hypothetical protein
MAAVNGERWARRAPWLNLVLPGGGLILVDRIVAGMVIGVIFTAAAGLALAMTLLVPDDFAPSLVALVVGVAGGSYVGAQVRLAQSLREQQAERLEHERSRRLRAAQGHLAAGDPVAALVELAPLTKRLPDDLLVAYRVAQAQAALGDPAAIRRAWAHVRTLDRHGLFRRARGGTEDVVED